MKRLGIALALCLFLSNQLLARPNFVIIMADDLGYGDISPFKGWIKTPNLDRLAKEGMKLTDFHSSGAVCSPTRAGLMTGRYQQRAGIPGVVFADPKRPAHKDGLQQSEITFAKLLKKERYATAAFGKWHLGYYPKYNPIRHGFDQYHGYVSGNIDFFSHVDQAGNFDWWQQDEKKDEKGYVTHLITKHAVKFIEDNRDKPFCLYLPHEAPHYPYQGPNDKPLRVVGKPRTKNELQMSQKEKKRAYREMLEEMDKSVGKVIETLKKHKLEKNTLVLFFSDNGATALGSNGMLRGQKGTTWEGGHRVPAIAWWPGKIKAGTTNSSLTITLDVMPTVLSLAGVALPKDHSLDGRDLSGALFQNDKLTRPFLFWQHGNSVAIRKGSWKLVKNGRGMKGNALFDLGKDPGEKQNVIKENQQLAGTLLSEIQKWQQEMKSTATKQPSSETE